MDFPRNTRDRLIPSKGRVPFPQPDFLPVEAASTGSTSPLACSIIITKR